MLNGEEKAGDDTEGDDFAGGEGERRGDGAQDGGLRGVVGNEDIWSGMLEVAGRGELRYLLY